MGIEGKKVKRQRADVKRDSPLPSPCTVEKLAPPPSPHVWGREGGIA
jgi:hypothetical protein